MTLYSIHNFYSMGRNTFIVIGQTSKEIKTFITLEQNQQMQINYFFLFLLIMPMWKEK